MYDFDGFINGIKYLDKEDILETAYKKHKALDKSSTMYTLATRMDLQNSVQALLCLLETGERSPGVRDADFMLLKPICENLIRKGQMDVKVLKIFE